MKKPINWLAILSIFLLLIAWLALYVSDTNAGAGYCNAVCFCDACTTYNPPSYCNLPCLMAKNEYSTCLKYCRYHR
jgi:hypothetical protein